MNDEKMVTSMENQADAERCDPIPSENQAEDSSPLTDTDPSTSDAAPDRSAPDDGGLSTDQPVAASTEEDRPAQDHLPLGDPLPDRHTDPDAALTLSAEERLGVLQSELKQLRDEVTAAKQMREDLRRMTNELREFQALYPEVPLSSIPDEILDGMYAGIPPAAGYALYLKREREKQKAADRINNANRQRSSGSLTCADADYFSPAEVRAMSQSEVRKNYQKIMQSMQKWH